MYKTALILAAGDGKRMKSKLPKVMHKVCGKQLVKHVFDSVAGICDDKPIVVVGRSAELVEELFASSARFARQEVRKGTAHAVMCAQQLFEDKDGYIIITAGDMPLLTAQTFDKLFALATQNEYSACVLTAKVENPFGYGRIIRNAEGCVVSIVEQRDASEEEQKINEVNTSVYCFNIKDLICALSQVKSDNAQGELYLTDTLSILNNMSKKVGACVLDDAIEAMGINDRVQLSEAEAQMRRRINKRVMLEGVTLIDPENTYIGADVKIGADTVIYPGSCFEGNTVIGEDCTIFSGCRIVDSCVGNKTEITSSVLLEAKVGNNTKVGPNAYLRKGTDVGDNARIGDFVEIKNARIGNGTKVSHLTYVGDATVGEDCNMGCGTVFVNYDGKNKHHSTVGNHVFIGCNSNIIAPVKIGDNAFIAAATTVTKDVEENDLSIGRSRQENKKGWVLNYKNW